MSKITLEKIKEKEAIPGFFGRFVHSEKMTVAYWKVKAGSIAPKHKHPHEQILTVISGTFEFSVNEDKAIYKEGDVRIIPSNEEHSGKALTDCYLIDIFCPVREDLK